MFLIQRCYFQERRLCVLLPFATNSVPTLKAEICKAVQRTLCCQKEQNFCPPRAREKILTFCSRLAIGKAKQKTIARLLNFTPNDGAHTGTDEQVLASEVPKISWIPLTLSG